MRVSSGESAVTTSSDAAVDAITAAQLKYSTARHLRVVTDVVGWVMVDNDHEHRLEVGVNTFYDFGPFSFVKIKRVASGSDMSAQVSVW